MHDLISCLVLVSLSANTNGPPTLQILEEVYRAINSMDLSRIPVLTEPQKVHISNPIARC
jgi:hypothetical protein